MDTFYYFIIYFNLMVKYVIVEEAFPLEDYHAPLVPLRRSFCTPLHRPHQALFSHLNNSALPLPRHLPCLHRIPLQHTVKIHATTICQQRPSKPLDKNWQMVSHCQSLVLSASLLSPLSIFNQAIQKVIEKFFHQLRTTPISNI